MKIKPIRSTLKSIFAENTRPTRLIMFWVYLLCSLSLAALGYVDYDGKRDSGGMGQLFSIAPPWFWVGVSLGMTWSRFSALFTDIPPTHATRLATPLTGILFWSFVISSCLFSQDAFGLELLLLTLAFTEVWILSRAITAKDLGTA